VTLVRALVALPMVYSPRIVRASEGRSDVAEHLCMSVDLDAAIADVERWIRWRDWYASHRATFFGRCYR
jgi:hypothetical protein